MGGKTTTTKTRGVTGAKRSATETNVDPATDATPAVAHKNDKGKAKHEAAHRSGKTESAPSDTTNNTTSKTASMPRTKATEGEKSSKKPASNGAAKPAPPSGNSGSGPKPSPSNIVAPHQTEAEVKRKQDRPNTTPGRNISPVNRTQDDQRPRKQHPEKTVAPAKSIAPDVPAAPTDTVKADTIAVTVREKTTETKHRKTTSRPRCRAYRAGHCRKGHPASWDPNRPKSAVVEEAIESESDDDNDSRTATPAPPQSMVPSTSEEMLAQKRTSGQHRPIAVNGRGHELSAVTAAEGHVDPMKKLPPICRNYVHRRCNKGDQCPRRHIRMPESRGEDAQSEPQRQVLAAAAAGVGSDAAGPVDTPDITESIDVSPVTVPKFSQPMDADPQSIPRPHDLAGAEFPSQSAPTPVSCTPAATRAPVKPPEDPKGISDRRAKNGGTCRYFLAGHCKVKPCRHSHNFVPPSVPTASSAVSVPDERTHTEEDVKTLTKSHPASPHRDANELGDVFNANGSVTEASPSSPPPMLHESLPPRPPESEDDAANLAAPRDIAPQRWSVDPRPARRFDEICISYRQGRCSWGNDCRFTHTLAIDSRPARRLNEVCHMYQLGVCDWGILCRRTHISPESRMLAPRNSRPTVSSAEPLSMQQTTRQEGRLADPELQHLPDAAEVEKEKGYAVYPREPVSGPWYPDRRPETMVSPSEAALDDRPSRTSNALCVNFQRGLCRYGKWCHRTHVLLDRLSQTQSPREESTELTCREMRPSYPLDSVQTNPPKAASSEREVCLNFAFRGTCLYGENCLYAHIAPVDAPNADTQPYHVTAFSSGSATPTAAPTAGSTSGASTSIRGDVSGTVDQIERSQKGATADDIFCQFVGSWDSRVASDHRRSPLLTGIPVELGRSGEMARYIPSSLGKDAIEARNAPLRPGEYLDYIRSSGNVSQRISNVGPRLLSRENLSERSEYAGVVGARNSVSIQREESSSDSSDQFFDAECVSSVEMSPQSSSSSFGSPPAPVERYKPICRDFLHGACFRKFCSFLHERQDDRKFGANDPRGLPRITERPEWPAPRREREQTPFDCVRAPRGTESERVVNRSEIRISDLPSQAAPLSVPLVPPGLGLEAMCSSGPLPLPRREPPTTFTLTVLDSTKVTYGPGFEVQAVSTGFESRQVVMSNLPHNAKPADITATLQPFGEVASVYISEQARKGAAVARVTFATAEQASRAASTLDGSEILGTTVGARLALGQSSLVGKARLADGDVLLEFPCAYKTAYIGFSTLQAAERAIALANEQEVKGNWVTAEMHEGLPVVGNHTVRLRGLPADTQVKDLARYGKSEGVMLERPNYDSLKQAINRLRDILDKFGDLLCFNVLPPPYKRGTVRAYAQYDTKESAEIVCASMHSKRQPFCGYGKLYATHVRTLLYTLPGTVYDSLASDIHLLNSYIWRSFEPGSSISIVDKRGTTSRWAPVRVKLASRHMQSLTKMKAHFERLLRGEKVVMDGQTIWDDFFSRSAGVRYLEDLQRHNTGVLVNRDLRKRTLSLFGPQSIRERVCAEILSKVAELREQKTHDIPLAGRLIGLFMSTDLADLKQRLGQENVTLDLTARVLRVRGDDDAYEIATLSVKRARERHLAEGRQHEVECPVCFDEVTNPVTLDCGHSWCKSCFQGYMRASVENKVFPLTCLGDEARCARPIPTHVAQGLLSPNDFDDIVQASFRAYVHARPAEFHYCPTPDCPQVYRKGSRDAVLQCPSCLARICPKCNVEYHEGTTCESSDTGDQILFEEWKNSHDVKDCPSCKAPIEREAGCNHMMCIRCKTHICWACLATFPNGEEVYDHMRLMHGGIGL